MNRVEFMTELASLLQDVPVEERREAMRYYNDYFDEAGKENEAQAISDLGSPARVAEKIKEDLRGPEQKTSAGEKDFRTEGGPQGPVPPGAPRPDTAASSSAESKILKIVLIILAIVVGAPIAVSYTHLDVYKRQEGYRPVCVPGALLYSLHLAYRHYSWEESHEPAGGERGERRRTEASGRGLPGDHRPVPLQPVCGDRLYGGRLGWTEAGIS